MTDTSPNLGPGNLSALGAVSAVNAGSTTVEALHDDFTERHNRWEPELNAIVAPIDRRGNPSGELAGVLMGVKDSVAVKGFERGDVGFLSGELVAKQSNDAVIVERLLERGVDIVARTSLPGKGSPGGMTPQTQNPRAWDRVAGGSSGGSAAAVAAGIVHAAIGTDSGGSIRIPAACCGVVGLNPTYGAVPGTLINSFVYTIASTGPIATSVADARAIYDVIAGPHSSDPATVFPPRPAVRDRHAGPLRIGLIEQVTQTNLDDEVRQAWDWTIERLVAEGATTSTIGLDDMVMVSVEGPRVLGISESAARIEDVYSSHAEMVVRADVQALFDAAKQLSGSETARAYKLAADFKSTLFDVFDDVDVLVLPTLPSRVPSAANPFEEEDIMVGGVVEPRVRALTRLVNPWNMSGLPAGTVPVRRDDGGGPIGMQVVGPWFEEHWVLDVMERIERNAGGPWDTEQTPNPS